MIFFFVIERQVKKQSVTEDRGQMTEDRRMIVSYDEIVKSTNTCHSGGACAGLGPV